MQTFSTVRCCLRLLHQCTGSRAKLWCVKFRPAQNFVCVCVRVCVCVCVENSVPTRRCNVRAATASWRSPAKTARTSCQTHYSYFFVLSVLLCGVFDRTLLSQVPALSLDHEQSECSYLNGDYFLVVLKRTKRGGGSGDVNAMLKCAGCHPPKFRDARKRLSAAGSVR